MHGTLEIDFVRILWAIGVGLIAAFTSNLQHGGRGSWRDLIVAAPTAAVAAFIP